jgi:mRNA interferase MazF
MAQSIVKRGSVVLIRYPFTDLAGAKVRPALVLTPDHLLPRLEDVLCLFISSVMPGELLPTDFILDPRHASFLNTGLKRRSVLRMHKLALLHKALVLRVLGEGDPSLMHEVNQRLRLALGL